MTDTSFKCPLLPSSEKCSRCGLNGSSSPIRSEIESLSPFDRVQQVLTRNPHLSMVDTHVHLPSKESFPDASVSCVLAAARRAGVNRIISVTESFAECAVSLERAARFPTLVRVCAGIHPVYYTSLTPQQRKSELDSLDTFFAQHHTSLVGIGEIGLDFSPWILAAASQRAAESMKPVESTSTSSTSSSASLNWKAEYNAEADAAQRTIQIDAFKHQLRLARKYQLPVNVHSRNASKHLVQILKEELFSSKEFQQFIPSVLLHAFDGAARTLSDAMALGDGRKVFFSVNASIGRDESSQRNICQILKESKRISIPRPDTNAHASSSSGSGEPTRSTSSSVTIPSALLQIVLETDSPALHPIKQPVASQSQADASSTTTCCVAANNEPCNLYVALVFLYDSYVAVEEARQKEEETKAEKKRKYLASKGAAVDTRAAVSFTVQPPLSLEELMVLLRDNSMRLFPDRDSKGSTVTAPNLESSISSNSASVTSSVPQPRPLTELLTIVIVTSCIPLHPSTEVIDMLIHSFRLIPELHNIRILIICDHPKHIIRDVDAAPDANTSSSAAAAADANVYKRGVITESRWKKYQQYIKNLRARYEIPCVDSSSSTAAASALLTNPIDIVELDTYHGFAWSLKYAMTNHVRTSYVLINQHDYVFTMHVPIEQLVRIMDASSAASSDSAVKSLLPSEVNYIGFVNKSVQDYQSLSLRGMPNSMKEHALHRPIDIPSRLISDNAAKEEQLRLFPLLFWYDKNHLARVSYYERVIFPHPRMCEAVGPGRFVEDEFGVDQIEAIRLPESEGGGMGKWKEYGSYLYWNDPKGLKIALRHVHGRRFHQQHMKGIGRLLAPTSPGEVDSSDEAEDVDSVNLGIQNLWS